MALADIVVADGQGTPVNHTFTYVSTVNNRVIRSDMAASAEEPLLMTHAHQATVRGGAKTKSHLYRVDRTKLDSDGVTPYTANIRIMADIPVAIQSDALADDLAAFVRNWATANNIRAWLKDSVG